MVDLSTIPDDQLNAMIQAQTAPVSSAILGQESGNNPNSPTSVDGAVGAAQITPATFAQYAQPGEDINNPDDNIAVHNRIIADLSQKAGGDPARIAVGYFSGPGNIAPPNSPTPWKADHKDGNGKSVSSYVSDVLGRINPVSDANASEPMAGTNPTSAPTNNLSSLSDADLDAQIAKLQNKPSLLSSATQPLRDFVPSMTAEANSGLQSLTKPFPYSTGSIGRDFLAGQKDVLSRAAGAAQYVASPITAAIHSFVGAPASLTSQELGMSPQNAKTYIQNPIELATNLALPMGIEKYTPELASSAGSIIDKLKSGDFLNDISAAGNSVLNSTRKIVGSVDPRTAQIVQDAADLGIDIPTPIFNPGATSSALNKIGLGSGNTMKSDVTTALSKAMGHEGTPNLDVDTMQDIQKSITDKMNDFATKADVNGGIPIVSEDLQTIADNSYADAPKVDKLMAKVTAKLGPNGTISGADYQSLTKKGGAIDKAMNSSDSDFADTASELRAHLDNQLESTVDPDDLTAFKEARRQYRTMKIVQPLVESGGVAGQPDSASKLFNAVSKNYGGMQNALKYNPELGKIAQIVNEFPETMIDAAKNGIVSAAGKLAGAGGALYGVGAVAGAPAAAAMAATLPAAKGLGMYLSSAGRKAMILKNSLKEGYSHGGIVTKRKEKLHEKHTSALKEKLGRDPKPTEVELAHYVGANGVKRLLNQKDKKIAAHKMFPQEIVSKNRQLFFDKRKPYTVEHLQSVL